MTEVFGGDLYGCGSRYFADGPQNGASVGFVLNEFEGHGKGFFLNKPFEIGLRPGGKVQRTHQGLPCAEQFNFFFRDRGDLQDHLRFKYLLKAVDNPGTGFRIKVIGEMGRHSRFTLNHDFMPVIHKHFHCFRDQCNATLLKGYLPGQTDTQFLTRFGNFKRLFLRHQFSSATYTHLLEMLGFF